MSLDLEKALALAKEKLKKEEKKTKRKVYDDNYRRHDSKFISYLDRDYDLVAQDESTNMRETLETLKLILQSYPDIAKKVDVHQVLFLKMFAAWVRKKGFALRYLTPVRAGLKMCKLVKK